MVFSGGEGCWEMPRTYGRRDAAEQGVYNAAAITGGQCRHWDRAAPKDLTGHVAKIFGGW